MTQREITLGAAARSVGMGFFAGALFVLTAMAVEHTILHEFSSKK